MGNGRNSSTPFGYTHLTVSNLERSVAFYQGALGLQIRSQDSSSSALGTNDTTLVVLSENSQAVNPGRSTGLYHFALRVPTRIALAAFIKQIIETQTPVQGVSDHGVSEAIYLPDPDGNGIEIYHDRPRRDWYDVSGELILTSQLLNLDDVLSDLSAGNGEWQGMPAGTELGHMHLHVADLETASQFYRDILGMDLMAVYGDSALFFSWNGYHHHVGVNTWNGVGAPRPSPEAIGLRYFTMQLNEKYMHDFRSRIDDTHTQVAEAHGGMFIRDPSGNGLVLQPEGS